MKRLVYNQAMSIKNLSGGVVHAMPDDLRDLILSDDRLSTLWESLTPLGRNEFICWVENAKQDQTRARRIHRVGEEMLEGKRRPCCWLGCIHRTDKAISPSVQGILSGKKRAATS
jgi:hypothetical protein